MFTQREKVLLAVGGSVLLHLVVLFAWALLAQWIPGARAISTPPSEPDPLKVEIVEAENTPPPPEPTPEPTMKPFLDTTELADATPPPNRAKFESGKDTVAASEEAPSGDQPLPTQRGKKLPTFAFSTQQYTRGEESSPAQDAPTPAPETAPPAPKPTGPRSSPRPPATPAAAPAATPAPTPEQIAADEQLAMLTPASIPVAPTNEPNPYDPAFRPPEDLTEPPMPTPNRTAYRPRTGFQPQEEKSSLSGGVSQQGTTSVDSEATPTGRYKSAVVHALKSCWFNYITQRTDLVSYGHVKIRVIVDREGRLRSPQVTSNTGNEALASVSLAAVMSARIPPMPSDVAVQFHGEQLQMTLDLGTE